MILGPPVASRKSISIQVFPAGLEPATFGFGDGFEAANKNSEAMN